MLKEVANPILEAMARLGQTENFSPAAPARRIVIVSDMLQNSDLFSAYGGGGALPQNMPDARSVAIDVERRYGRAFLGRRTSAPDNCALVEGGAILPRIARDTT